MVPLDTRFWQHIASIAFQVHDSYPGILPDPRHPPLAVGGVWHAEPGNACIPTDAPAAKPPKPADRIAPLIILYSDSLCIYCREAARHDCHGNAMGASLYIAGFILNDGGPGGRLPLQSRHVTCHSSGSHSSSSHVSRITPVNFASTRATCHVSLQ